jgi:uncharacterized protein (DUF427 family)
MNNPAPGFQRHPGHRVAIAPSRSRVRVEFNGAEIAASDATLLVDESRHEPVHYVPIDAVRMEYLQPTTHTSYCPFKGHARYWTIAVDGRSAVNAVWAYDEPYDEALPLRGHAAFYPDRVALSVDAD